jgi:hypothetical protein
MFEVMVRTKLWMDELVDTFAERLNAEEGQTAAEYTGILVLVGLIFAGLFGLGIPGKIEGAVTDALNKILKG